MATFDEVWSVLREVEEYVAVRVVLMPLRGVVVGLILLGWASALSIMSADLDDLVRRLRCE